MPPAVTAEAMRGRAAAVRRSALHSGWILGVLLLGVCGCTAATARPPSAQVTGAAVPNLFDVQQQIDQYISSGRYDADVARVVHDAQAYLEQRAGAVSKPAIVLDIDETSLSNWPAYKVNGWTRILNGSCDLHQGPCNVRVW